MLFVCCSLLFVAFSVFFVLFIVYFFKLFFNVFFFVFLFSCCFVHHTPLESHGFDHSWSHTRPRGPWFLPLVSPKFLQTLKL